jgi:internalin A
VLSELRELEDLTLRSLSLPCLDLLVPLTKLRSLDIKLGGTTDLRPLSDLAQIEYLELWMIRGFSDLSEVSGLTGLRYLFLQALKQVTALPDFSRSSRLERIHLETMKSLTDLRPLRNAPALRDLNLVDMPQLRWEHLEPLMNHPTLRGLRLGTGSKKRNADFRARLGYPDTEAPSDELRRLSRGELA